MRFAIAITTHDRGAVGRRNYLGETLLNLERGGLWTAWPDWALAIIDGGSPEGYIEREVPLRLRALAQIVRPPAGRILTPNENAAVAWRVVSEDPRADWVLVLEDDIDVCANFLDVLTDWLTTYARADRHLYPLGCPYEAVATWAAAGGAAWDYPISDYWASQATAARPGAARSLAAYLTAHPLQAGTSTHSRDWLMRDWALETYPEVQHFLTPAPGLVQHVGRESFLAVLRLRESQDAIVFFDFPSWRGRGDK